MNLKRCATVDNDFINHLIESNQPLDAILKYTKNALDDFELTAIIHPLVFEHEVPQEKPNIRRLFVDEIILTLSYEDIFENDEEKEAYYLFIANECLNHFHSEPSFNTIAELWNFWSKKCSLGELHSLTMCAVCSCGMFLSDDKGSKRIKDYIKTSFHKDIKTYSRKEFFSEHRDLGKTSIPPKIRKSLSHERCN